jgi:HPt (histidine-containing phosphotransfer) domain-containing protein
MTETRGDTMTEAGTLLDIARIDSLVDEIGDRVLVREALQTFVDEVPGRIAAIREALAGGDDPEIKSAAHALGSPAAMLGAIAVRTSTRAMQDAATAGRSADYPALFADIDEVTAQTVQALRAYLASDPA